MSDIKELSDVCKGPKILLVEDEPIIRELVETRLMRLGYQVFSAETAEQALSHINDVDIIFTDLKMKGSKGGYWLMAQLPQGKAVVVMTAALNIDDRIVDTAAAILRKPFERTEFEAAVRKAERYVKERDYQPAA